MQRKQSESEFANLMARHNIWCHKWRDVMRCPRCGASVFMTNRTDQADQRAEPESIVDYMIVVGNELAWVECKQERDTFPLSDINLKQRVFLNDWTNRKVSCWLFLLMGTGNPRKDGRLAWLIDWDNWLGEESIIEGVGLKSLAFEPNQLKVRQQINARQMLEPWVLKWFPKIGWIFPDDHPFLLKFPNIFHLPPLYQESNHAELTA